jgi:hypothetical protein
MAATDHRIPTVSIGRGFACMDPERQREIVGYVRTSPPAGSPRVVRPTTTHWIRVQPDRDLTGTEGSSSRRSR